MRKTLSVVAVFLAACGGPPKAAGGDMVAQWLRSSLSFVRSERLGPPVASRISAYAAIALYEGYASDESSGLPSLRGRLNGFSIPYQPAPSVDGAAVAARAIRVVLDSLFRDGFASTRRTVDSLSEAQLRARQDSGASVQTVAASKARGDSLGAAILAWAAADGFFATLTKQWTPATAREQWSNTATQDQFVPIMLSGESDLVAPTNPNVSLDLERAGERFVFTNRPKAAGATTLPTFNPVKPTAPFWGELRTFALKDGDECRPPAPPGYSEKSNTPFWAMAKAFADSMATLTPEKKQTALFWADNPVATGTPGFHWISVVNQMIGKRNLSAPEAARLYAFTSVAIADAFIATWREKYRSMVVRPVTYMHRVFDKTFTTVIPTPPFPEYPSGHSVQSAAAVQVLNALVGNAVAFEDATQVDIGHPPRSFASFNAALAEVAVSRIYAGVHYAPAVVDGMVQGECIGQKVLQRLNVPLAAR